MIPITRPVLGDIEAAAAAKAVMSGWLSQGPEVAAFEKEFAEVVGAPFACAVSNCTTALHLALLVGGVGAGDEVITVSHSFIATANVVRACAATPVFVDIDPRTYNIDVERIAGAITVRTKAILCVHQLGMPCDLERVLAIAQAHNLVVIEDAACAIGSRIQLNGEWRPIGAPHGDVACFSFHPRKVITTGEGGMLTTRHSGWDRQFRLLRQHGMSVSDSVRHNASKVLLEQYIMPGFNYRMTDVQAAIGRCQLDRLPEILTRRRELANAYNDLLADVHGITLPFEPKWARSNWQSYCVRLPPRCDQLRVMQTMLDENIATRRGVMCSHLEPAYGSAAWPPLPKSEAAHRDCLLLPLYHEMTADHQRQIVDALKRAIARETLDVAFAAPSPEL